MASIKERLTDFILTELMASGDAPFDPDENLLLSGGVDSIGMMRLVAFIDDEYDFSVPPEDVVIENFKSVNAIAAYVEHKLQK